MRAWTTLVKVIRVLRPYLADRDTWFKSYKAIDGIPLEPVAVQKSRRRNRKGKTTYVYAHRGNSEIVYNHSAYGVMFMPIAYSLKDRDKYWRIFVSEKNTKAAVAFRRLNDYVLV